MASARPGVHIIKLKKVCVPTYMTDKPAGPNEFTFIKWHEDTGVVYPVNLRVDQNGYYIYYENINKEVEFIDTLMIKDMRVGKSAKAIKDPKIKSQILNITGLSEVNNNNYLTIVTGLDFVNLTYINFYCLSTDLNERWASEILTISYNILQVNNSTVSFLLKIYTKIILSVGSANNNKLLMKNIIKIFTSNKDERKRVEKALDSCGLPSGKTDTIDITQFNFDLFLQFYKNLTNRIELEAVFNACSNNNKLSLMSSEQFMNFINNEQRDPRLNEILYPYLTVAKTNELINIYEPNVYNSQRNFLSLNGFINYLLSDDNNIISMEKYDIIEDDMTHPLNHYFINSSHNTYLIGHQLTGKSSVEMYRQSLLAGCRCIELDFWNGKFDEPVIMHGYTLVPEIPAKDVIEAIADCAFKTSKYPVILSFENHCSPKQQAKIAKYCYDFFGDMLLTKPLEAYPLQPGVSLPPPSALMNRIIIKNKKKHHHHSNAGKKSHHHAHPRPAVKESSSVEKKDEAAAEGEDDVTDDENLKKTTDSELSGDENLSTSNSDTSEEENEDEEAVVPGQSNDLDITKLKQSDKGTAGKESEAGAEISALVNYVQPVHFYSFDYAVNKNKSYEMSSFDENQAMKLLKERPKEFVNYNKFQLTRVYPRGTRVDSTNFMPQLFWNAGCQLVALNYQTLDLPMQLNLGIFEQNHRAGYLLKPECMRRNDRDFDPFAENTIDGIIAGSLEIKVISGQFLTDKRVGTYIEVEMYGLPTDTVKKRFRTKMVPLNGINPIYDEEPFIFKKIVLPNLAYLRIIAYEESGKIIGHRILPIIGLRPGYRHITLRSESGIPLILPTLFLKIRVKDFVPDKLSELAEALSNPIKYQNEIEKRENQMSIFQDDADANGGTPHPLDRNKSIVKKKIDEDKDKYSSSPPKYPSPTKTSSFENPTPSPGASSSYACSAAAAVAAISLNSTGAGGGSISGPSGLSASGMGGGAMSSSQQQQYLENTYYANEYVAKGEVDTLEKFWNNKLIIEKRVEIDKKIDTFKKKHEKERKGEKPVNIKSHAKLMKRVSSKNLELTMHKDSELQNNLYYQQLVIERFTLEEGYKELFIAMENVIKTTQQKRLKLIENLEIKDISNIMANISQTRKNEFKQLTSKKYKDKAELDRLKREIANSMVERGVNERAAMSNTYAKYKCDLELLYSGIMNDFANFKKKKFDEIVEEFEKNKKLI